MATVGNAYSSSTGGGGVVLPVDMLTGGYYDYNDAATSITPIVVTGGAGPIVMTNDTLGPQTLRAFAPDGAGDIWNPSTNEFDFSGVSGTGLSVGTRLGIRLDMEIDTASVNTEVRVDLHFAAGLFKLSWLNLTNYKASGVQQVTAHSEFHIGSAFVLGNGAQFKIEADKTCSVKVLGFFCSVVAQG